MQLPNIANLLPHKPPALLLDEVIAVEPGKVRCGLTVRSAPQTEETHELIETSIGIEYLAQAAGVGFGLSRTSGAQVQTGSGLLLAVRSLECNAHYFRVGQRLIAEADSGESLEEGALFICAGSLYDADSGEKLMSATLTIMSDEDYSGRIPGE